MDTGRACGQRAACCTRGMQAQRMRSLPRQPTCRGACEMCANVITHHRVGDAINAVAALRSDPVERVRAADRAVRVLADARA